MADRVYTVAKGDTLSSIAQKHGVSIDELLRLNPSLKKNPNLIFPGMSLAVTSKSADDPRISKMSFDGKTLKIYSVINNQLIASYPAISGLPPNAPHLTELINAGRKDLDKKTDYTQAKFQNVKDAGPIPEDNYALPLTPNMPYDKSKAAGDGLGWGEGGWLLKEGILGRLNNLFGGRSGFFLHHDGGSRGTSGCIGLRKATDMKALRTRLQNAQKKGQQSVTIEVKY